MDPVKSRSFTAAGSLPAKLLQLKEQCVDARKHIIPMHIQLIPTNRCNANCPWCSCSKVDRELEMGIAEIKDLLAFFAERGTRAITITGGGEPTLHPNLPEIIAECRKHMISIGMVSNGLRWGKGAFLRDSVVATRMDSSLDWLRVSTLNTGTHGEQARWLAHIAETLPSVDVSASFTVAEDVSHDLAREICAVAEQYDNITHVRFVGDILNPRPEPLQGVKSACEDATSKAIYQDRTDSVAGAHECRISLLKPLIDPLGRVFPCCGVQYANKSVGNRELNEQFSMGHWVEYDSMVPFCGKVCDTCYYGQYNEALEALAQPLRHIYHV